MDWTPRARNYTAEYNSFHKTLKATSNHPLQSSLEKKRTAHDEKEQLDQKINGPSDSNPSDEISKMKTGGLEDAKVVEDVDPLTAMLAKAIAASSSGSTAVDPLSAAAALNSSLSDPYGAASAAAAGSVGLGSAKDSEQVAVAAEDGDSFESWSSRRNGILAKYTTSEKLSIVTSFLQVGDRTIMKAQTALTDKVKHRLEQLDDFEGADQEKLDDLSQQDYMNRIEELNSELIRAWDADQRVKSLKIAIQCAKLLADTSVIRFYPSKFVLITDILDTFGRLVYDRIRRKSTYFKPGSSKPVTLPEDFTPDMVPDSAKETCRNWFFKIASIRELIPRMYVEAAILKCYSFLTANEYTQSLARLTSTIRGIGDPLAATYARTYLSRVGWLVAPNVRMYLQTIVADFFFTYKQVGSQSVAKILQEQNVEIATYLNLFTPAVEWLLSCIAHKAPESTMEKILQHYKDSCSNAIVLNAIMTAFRPSYIAAKANVFAELIRNAECTGLPIHELYRTLGLNLVLSDPPEQDRRAILNEVWKVVMKLSDVTPYISCAEVWIEYPVKHFGAREINTLLGDIIKHVTIDRAFESFYPQLQSIVNKVLTHMTDFGVLFAMDRFLPFIDLFQKESVHVEVCKSIMEAFVRRHAGSASDPVILNALMFIGKVIHDSIDALSFEDEKRQISTLLCSFLRKISFGRDLEQQLNFYVEARANFTNLDSVLIFLTHSANALVMKTQAIVKGKHSKKTAAFVRACIAYSFITIPSIVDVVSRLNLYLLSGQVALANQALPQADAFFRAAITLIPDIPKITEIDMKQRSTEPILINFLHSFLSALLVIPDHPDHGKLYMVKGLINLIQSYQWDENADGKIKVYLSILTLMCAMYQDQYLYKIDHVESNDTLYGGDSSFLEEVQNVLTAVNEEILGHLSKLSEANTTEAFTRQSELAIGLFNRLISNADLTIPKNASLAANLWNLAKKNPNLDHQLISLMRKSATYLKNLSQELPAEYQPAYDAVISKLK